jgi:hypothetical protein
VIPAPQQGMVGQVIPAEVSQSHPIRRKQAPEAGRAAAG